MKILFTLIVIVIFCLIVLAATGSYPVALVGNMPIFARTWHKAESAAKRFSDAQAQASRALPINFSSDEGRELLLEVKRGTLTFLIEDVIIRQKGDEVIEGLGVLSRERALEALRSSTDPTSAAKAVYGLSLNDFRNLVLLPQARQDVLKEALMEKGQNFDTWLRDAKKSTRVRLFFVPFRWNGETVK